MADQALASLVVLSAVSQASAQPRSHIACWRSLPARLSPITLPQPKYSADLQTMGPLAPPVPTTAAERAAGLVQYAVGGKIGGEEFILVSQWGCHDTFTKTEHGGYRYKSESIHEPHMPLVPCMYDQHFAHFISEFLGIFRFDDKAEAWDDSGYLALPGVEKGRVLGGSRTAYHLLSGGDDLMRGPGLVTGRAIAIKDAITCDERGRTVLHGYPLARRFLGGAWEVQPTAGEPIASNGWVTNESFLHASLLDDEKVAQLHHTVPAVPGEAGPAARRWERLVAARMVESGPGVSA